MCRSLWTPPPFGHLPLLKGGVFRGFSLKPTPCNKEASWGSWRHAHPLHPLGCPLDILTLEGLRRRGNDGAKLRKRFVLTKYFFPSFVIVAKTTIMREVTINIPNTDFSFFQRMVQGFGWKYTERVSTPSDSKEEVLSSLDRAFAEFRQMQSNGQKGRRAEELIDEL